MTFFRCRLSCFLPLARALPARGRRCCCLAVCDEGREGVGGEREVRRERERRDVRKKPFFVSLFLSLPFSSPFFASLPFSLYLHLPLPLPLSTRLAPHCRTQRHSAPPPACGAFHPLQQAFLFLFSPSLSPVYSSLRWVNITRCSAPSSRRTGAVLSERRERGARANETVVAVASTVAGLNFLSLSLSLSHTHTHKTHTHSLSLAFSPPSPRRPPLLLSLFDLSAYRSV